MFIHFTMLGMEIPRLMKNTFIGITGLYLIGKKGYLICMQLANGTYHLMTLVRHSLFSTKE